MRLQAPSLTLFVSFFLASFRAADPVQSFRTSKFIQQKLKNESVENRIDVLQAVSASKARNFDNTLISVGMTDEHKQVWFEMLNDALESQVRMHTLTRLHTYTHAHTQAGVA